MLNDAQYKQLLKDINPKRVLKKDGLSHVEAWEIRAHLNRIFGFGDWSADLTDLELLYEEETKTKQGKPAYRVAYRATVRLTIHSLNCTYTAAAVGEGLMPDFKRGDTHDFAIKTAESQALKRCAMNLGTQFGLSLYNNGSIKDIVGATLDRDTVSQGDVQPEHIVVVAEGQPETAMTDTSESVPDSEGAKEWIDSMKEAIDAKDVPALLNIKKAMTADGVAENVYQGVTLAKWLDKAMAQAGKNNNKSGEKK